MLAFTCWVTRLTVLGLSGLLLIIPILLVSPVFGRTRDQGAERAKPTEGLIFVVVLRTGVVPLVRCSLIHSRGQEWEGRGGSATRKGNRAPDFLTTSQDLPAGKGQESFLDREVIVSLPPFSPAFFLFLPPLSLFK